MKQYIALLRGINVGGHHIIKMAALKALANGLGFENVKTYIQSGNLIFSSDIERGKLADLIGTAIETSHGFKPEIFIIELTDLRNAIAQQSLEFEKDNCLFLYFLNDKPQEVNVDKIEQLLAFDETYKLTDNVFYIHCPAGVHKSRLAAKIERLLGVKTTARNLRSVNKIITLAMSA